MIRKGIRFKRIKHLGWRQSKQTDRYLNGTSMEPNYVAIVRIKDCLVDEETNTYDPSDAPVIPLKYHSRTNMAYGKSRIYTEEGKRKTPVYWVEDGYVYRGSVSQPLNQ